MTENKMAFGPFHNVSVQDLGERIRRGELRSTALAEQALDSIARLNPRLNAFVHCDAQAVMEQARRADQEIAAGRYRGPLHGIPVALKDIIDTIDMPTTYGSRFYADHQPAADAQCVANLRRAGAVIVGKTLTSEFAMGPTGEFSLQGASRNPYDPDRVTGGSSAGSGCAVGAGMVPLAVGTDTGGSIRIPAAYCGAVGLKPTYEKVSRAGVFPASTSLDHVGPIAANCGDAALLLAALAGDPSPRLPARPTPVRAAWLDTHELLEIEPQVQRAVEAYAQARFGEGIVRAELAQGLLGAAKQALPVVFMAEANAVHAERMRDAPEKFCPSVAQRLGKGASTPAWQYVRAFDTRARLIQAIDALFERFDVLLMPTIALAAPPLGSTELKVGSRTYPILEVGNALTGLWNLAGYPALTVPAGTVDGLPVALQAIGPMGSDYRLLGLLAD